MIEDQLAKWRESIDQLDSQILELLHHRFEITAQIMEWKVENEKPLEDLERESNMLEILKEKAKGLSLNPDFVQQLYQLILTYSKGK